MYIRQLHNSRQLDMSLHSQQLSSLSFIYIFISFLNTRVWLRTIKPAPWVQIAVGGANIQMFHYSGHGYLGEETSMIHSFTVTIEANYLTWIVTNVPPYETFILIKNNILHPSKNYKKSRKKFKFLRYVTFRSCWSCDIQFHQYAVHFNGDLCL